MGLVVARQLIQSMRGTLAASHDPALGVCMRIELRRAHDRGTDDEEAPPDQSDAEKSSGESKNPQSSSGLVGVGAENDPGAKKTPAETGESDPKGIRTPVFRMRT